MSRFLSRHGEDVTIVITDKGLTQDVVDSMRPCRVVALRCLNERFYVPEFSLNLIDKLVAETDIIHLMGHWGILNALVYRAARRLNKPYVVCPAGALVSYGRSAYIKRIFDTAVGRDMMRYASRSIAITENEKEDFERYGIDSSKIVVLPNGINPDDLKDNRAQMFRERFKLASHPFILFLGRLNSIKGPDLLLKAFGQLQPDEYHLVFAGLDEGEQGALEASAREFGISDRVHFIGHLGPSEKSRALHACSLLAIPSRREAMSIVALEAGATATPVVLTDQCGFDEIGEIGGGVVTPATIEGLRSGLQRILAQDLTTTGRRLQAYCLEHFAWDAVVTKYVLIYQSILDDRVSESNGRSFASNRSQS